MEVLKLANYKNSANSPGICLKFAEECSELIAEFHSTAMKSAGKVEFG